MSSAWAFSDVYLSSLSHSLVSISPSLPLDSQEATKREGETDMIKQLNFMFVQRLLDSEEFRASHGTANGDPPLLGKSIPSGRLTLHLVLRNDFSGWRQGQLKLLPRPGKVDEIIA